MLFKKITMAAGWRKTDSRRVFEAGKYAGVVGARVIQAAVRS